MAMSGAGVLSEDTLGGMCRRTTCKQCGKPGWAGCGAHVEMVLGDVPRSERCRCNESGGTKAMAQRTAKAGHQPQPAGALAKFAAWLRK